MRSHRNPACFPIFALILALIYISPARADDDQPPIDPFNLGLNFTDFCDLRDGGPMSEKCWGFMAAAIEINQGYSALDPDLAKRVSRACIPPGMSVTAIYNKIRPQLRRIIGSCRGLCDSTAYVMSSLAGTFPCEK